MKKVMLFTLSILAGYFIYAQLPSVGFFRYDTVLIYKQGGTAELVVRNKTKDSLGFMFNKGNGITEFRRMKQLNDSTLIFGVDTFRVRTTGGGGGSANSNVGTGFNFAIAGTNNIKRFLVQSGVFISLDSIISNSIRLNLDTVSLYNDFAAKRPFQLKVNPTYFTTSGDSLDFIPGSVSVSANNPKAVIYLDKAPYSVTEGSDWGPAMQAAIDSLWNTYRGGDIYVGLKSVIQARVVIGSQKGINLRPNIRIHGNNTLVMLAGNSSIFNADFRSDSLGTTITANTDSLTTNLTVVSSASFAVGDTVYLRLIDAPYDSPTFGEPLVYGWFIVKAIPNSTHITLDRPCGGNMTAASTSTLNRRVIRVHNRVDNVLIEGFHFYNPQTGGAYPEGAVVIQGGVHNTVRGCYATNMGIGIVGIQFNDYFTLENCTVVQSLNLGNANFGNCLRTSESDHTTIRNCHFAGFQSAAIVLEAGNAGTILENVTFNNNYNDSIRNAIRTLGNKDIVATNTTFTGFQMNFLEPVLPYGTVTFNTSTIDVGTPMLGFEQQGIIFNGLNIGNSFYYGRKRVTQKFLIAPNATTNITGPYGLVTGISMAVHDTVGIDALRFCSRCDFGDNTIDLQGDLRNDTSRLLITGAGATYQLGNLIPANSLNSGNAKGGFIVANSGLAAGNYATITWDYIEQGAGPGSTAKNYLNFQAYDQPLGGGSGTVTDLTASTGILGGVITSSGTIKADTALLATKGALVKARDSVQGNLTAGLATKQATLVSGTNIVTINGNSLLTSGNLSISGGATDLGKSTAANSVTITSSTGASTVLDSANTTRAGVFTATKYKELASKPRVFNPKDYGAVGDGVTNNTTAVAATVAALYSAGGGVIHFDAGKFLVDSIRFPAIATRAGYTNITIEGDGYPLFYWGTVGTGDLPNKGTILVSKNTTSGNSVIKADPVHGPDFSAVNVYLKDLEIRTYNNPSIGGVDMGYAAFLKMENVFINTDTLNVVASLPTHGTSGLITPIIGNGAMSLLDNVTICGYFIGLKAGEHTSSSGDLNIASCYRGIDFQFTAGHASNFLRLGSYRNKYALYVTGSHRFTIEQMNSEHTDSATQTNANNVWQISWADLKDTANLGKGNILWASSRGNGPAESVFTIDGAANMITNEIGTSGSGGGLSGLTSGRIPITTGSTSISDDSKLRWDNTNKTMSIGGTPNNYYLNVSGSNSDGGSTPFASIAVVNTNTAAATGSDYNYGAITTNAGNGLVIGQSFGNYGTGATAPFSTGSGYFVGSRSNHPLYFFTNSATIASLSTAGLFKLHNYTIGSGAEVSFDTITYKPTVMSSDGTLYRSNFWPASSSGGGGSGISGLTTGRVPVAASGTTIADGAIRDNGSTIGIGVSPTNNAISTSFNNNDGGSTAIPSINLNNTNTSDATGSDYNFSAFTTNAKNGAVTGQFFANAGTGATAPFSYGTGVYIGTRTNHGFSIFTNNTARMGIDGSGNLTFTLGSDATGDMFYRNSSGYFTRLPIGGAGQHIVGGTTPHWVDTAAVPVSSITTGTLTATSATTDVSANLLTTANDATVHIYTVGMSYNISSNSGTVSVTVTYKDQNNNTAVADFFRQGTTTATFGSTGTVQYPPMVITVYPNTTPTIKYTISGGTVSATGKYYIQKMD